MSLEEQIEKNTAALVELTAAFNRFASNVPAKVTQEAKTEVKPVKEEVKAKTEVKPEAKPEAPEFKTLGDMQSWWEQNEKDPEAAIAVLVKNFMALAQTDAAKCKAIIAPSTRLFLCEASRIDEIYEAVKAALE